MNLKRGILVLLAAGIVTGATPVRADRVTSVIGLVNLTNYQAALLAITDSPPDSAFVVGTHLWVTQGQSFGDLQLLSKQLHVDIYQIDFNGATVQAEENGMDTLYLPVTTNLATVAVGKNFLLSGADFNDALDLYARLKGRSVLVHPQVKQSLITLAAAVHSQAEAAGALAKALQGTNAMIVADGNKFEWIMPAGTATPALPARQPPSTNALETLPPGSINFSNTDLQQVLGVYQALTGRKRIQDKPIPAGITMSFHNQTPLTKYEILHALDVMLAWHGVKIVNVGDSSFKLAPISTGK